MIKYKLTCSQEHAFEGWFRSSADYDEQSDARAVECPICGSSETRKAIMAPAIARRSRSGNPGPTGDAREARLRELKEHFAEAAQRARDYVEKNFDYVGDQFPEEARRIHYGESDDRRIYGEASVKDAQDLAEEGVEIAPLPGVKPSIDGNVGSKPMEAKLAGDGRGNAESADPEPANAVETTRPLGAPSGAEPSATPTKKPALNNAPSSERPKKATVAQTPDRLNSVDKKLN